MVSRSKPKCSATAQPPSQAPSTTPLPATPKPLPPSDSKPRALFILPAHLASSDNASARIFTHPHPRTRKPSRFFYCPAAGPRNGCCQTAFYEIKQLSSSCAAQCPAGMGKRKRSLLLAASQAGAGSVEDDAGKERETAEAEAEESEGYVARDASFLTVTPLDALFLVLPFLGGATRDRQRERERDRERKYMYLSVSDHFDAELRDSGSGGRHLRHIARDAAAMALLERSVESVCDATSTFTDDGEEERMYRFNAEKLLVVLLGKARSMVRAGLPESLERAFVGRVLEVPMAVLLERRKTQSETQTRGGIDGVEEDSSFSSASGSSSGAASQPESQDTTITVPSPVHCADEPSSLKQTSSLVATDELRHLLRLRVALNFLVSSYIPTHLGSVLEALLLAPSPPVDFGPLTTHLARLAEKKAQVATAARELMAGDSRKRALDEDEEAAADREEKRRRKEDEERKRRANESRGVRDLKKVDTKGMKKMSDFFGKKM